jgi:hypothetical protein
MRLLEYSAIRFKALAYVIEAVDRILPQGNLVDTLPLHRVCGVYAFSKDGGKWKLAAFFDATETQYIDRDWRNMPNWQKQIIGDLPDQTTYFCDSNKLEK